MTFWQHAEEIEIVEDAANAGLEPISTVTMVCDGFIHNFGTDWSWNTFNDDLSWAAWAFTRAYFLTGNVNYRTYAKNAADLAYSRGWDTVNGGLFMNTAKTNPKPWCANGSAACSNFKLYQACSDSAYRVKAVNLYNWGLANVYNASTGAVMEGPGTGNYFPYDSGTFATIAYWLSDFAKANKAGDWVQNHWSVAMASYGAHSDAGGFNGICLRGLARTGYNLAYLRTIVDGAWGYRNSSGLTFCNWTHRTSDASALYSWDCSSHVAGYLTIPL